MLEAGHRETGPVALPCLHGWKAIADYLGKSVRTVQRWEHELGLPVRRVSSAKGDTVFALPHELSAWLEEYTSTSKADLPIEEIANHHLIEGSGAGPVATVGTIPRLPHVSWRNVFAISLAFGVFLIVILAAVTAQMKAIKHNMAAFRVERNFLIVLDEKGKEQWRHVFQEPLDKQAYESPRHLTAFTDLNGDGKREFLFAYTPLDTRQFTSVLYCFSEDGQELWHFTPGRSIRTGDESFDPPFYIYDFALVPGRPSQKIVVVSEHHLYFPSVANLLNNKGEVLGEYWHSGQMRSPVVFSPSKNDHFVVLLGAPNNEFHSATLIGLEIDRFPHGVSAQVRPRYQIQNMPIAHEYARLLFPTSCINRLEYPTNHVLTILLEDGAPTVLVGETLEGPPAVVIYHFSPDLKLKDVSVSYDFLSRHKELESRRELDHSFSDQELKRFWAVVPPPLQHAHNIETASR